MNDTPPRHRPATADEIRTRRGIAAAPTDRAVTLLLLAATVWVVAQIIAAIKARKDLS